MKIRSVPSAFPTPTHNLDNDGMTLRDYFAGLAMQAIVRDLYEDGIYINDGNEMAEMTAISAYMMADAMLGIRRDE